MRVSSRNENILIFEIITILIDRFQNWNMIQGWI